MSSELTAVPMMTCDWCGKEFPADARACVEGGVAAVVPAEPGEEWKGETPVTLDPGELTADQRAALKRELGLEDADLDRLLTTGEVDGVGVIVCLPCQAEAERAATDGLNPSSL